jgi:hypothetical protein
MEKGNRRDDAEKLGWLAFPFGQSARGQRGAPYFCGVRFEWWDKDQL